MTHAGNRWKNLKKSLESEYDIDDKIKPAEGQSRVYMVPRPSQCISEKFLQMMNNLGNIGGFDCMIDILENEPAGKNIDLNSICYISTMFSMPIGLWHKDWINENATKIKEAVKKNLTDSSD